MLESMQSGVLEYKKLSKEEMEQRGILGRLVGVCADFLNPTRNGRKYPEKLWENVFNDPIMKERIENNCCFGELGHPADREETDMEKIAVVMDGVPKKDKDGKLRAVFNIVNTPNGRILKSLCDYGSTLGISSRGSGDLETDFDGQESVNPDTYNCEGFDVVLIPAVKEARLQYVTEALDKKRYNKTLREKLTESINKETEEHQKVMKESLGTLGIDLTESQYNDYEVQNTESGTIVRDSKGKFIREFPTDDEATEWIDDQELDESTHLSKDWKTLKVGDEVTWTSKEFDGDTTWDCIVKDVYGDHIIICPKDAKFSDMCLWIDDDMLTESLSLEESKSICEARKLNYAQQEAKMDAWHNGTRGFNVSASAPDKLLMNHKICWEKGYGRELEKIENEMLYKHIPIPSYSDTAIARRQRSLMGETSTADVEPEESVPTAPTKPTCKFASTAKKELLVLADAAGEELISKFIDPFDLPTIDDGSNNYYVIEKSMPFAQAFARELVKILKGSELSEQLESIFPEDNAEEVDIDEETRDIETTSTADDDGVMVEELQKSLDLNRKLDKKIVGLQEKLSVSYAKEISLQEELEKYKSKVIKLSRRLAEEKVLNEKLTDVQKKKVIADKNCEKLTESVKSRNVKITSLKESIAKKNEQVKSLTEQVQQLVSTLDERNNQIETLTEKYETLNKDYQQMKETYSAKMNSQTELVEKYRNVAVKSVNKYIDTQATRLGVTSAEIKNRLPESYSFSDIDRVCEDLQEYKLSISSLPFNTGNRLNEGIRVKANNVSQRTLVPVEEELDDLTLRLAGFK